MRVAIRASRRTRGDAPGSSWKRVVAWTVLMILPLAITSCGLMSSSRINIRIRNNSDIDISNFWLGAGSGAGGPGSRAYGDIRGGATTPYRSLKPEFGSYSNYNFVTADGRRFVGSTFANDLIGQVALEPDYYTFVFTIVDNKAAIQIIREKAQ